MFGFPTGRAINIGLDRGGVEISFLFYVPARVPCPRTGHSVARTFREPRSDRDPIPRPGPARSPSFIMLDGEAPLKGALAHVSIYVLCEVFRARVIDTCLMTFVLVSAGRLSTASGSGFRLGTLVWTSRDR